jgi:hypothetical protein
VASLRASPERLLSDMEWFGFLFESLVVRDSGGHAVAVEVNADGSYKSDIGPLQLTTATPVKASARRFSRAPISGTADTRAGRPPAGP